MATPTIPVDFGEHDDYDVKSRWPPRAMVSPRAMSYCDDGSDHAYDDRDYEVDDNT